jgi:hypothetical protein
VVKAGLPTPSDMLVIADGCVRFLVNFEDGVGAAEGWIPSVTQRRNLQRYLITAMLILSMSPRSQCIHLLTELPILPSKQAAIPFVRSFFPPRSYGNDSDQYLISIVQFALKHKRSWEMQVPQLLTRHVDFWRKHCTKPGQQWVFLNEGGKRQAKGAARFTKPVCKRLIGREVTAKASRAITGDFFNSKDLTLAEERTLEHDMQHKLNNHYTFYVGKSKQRVSKLQGMLLEAFERVRDATAVEDTLCVAQAGQAKQRLGAIEGQRREAVVTHSRRNSI